MGRMWVCEGKLAKKPLLINASISLYSLEELCYYLYHNADSVEESFYHEALCQWLSEELGMEKLAEQVREGIEKGKSGAFCMELILATGGFYSRKEINQAVSIVQNMESTSPAQRAKLRGDRFLKSGQYRKAWIEYQKALEEEGDMFFQGQVWHNLGTLYARQFLFGAAGECYKKAYEVGQQSQSSEAYLLALTCRDEQQQGQQHRQGSFAGELRRIQEMKASGDRAGYENMVEDLLQQLRTEYRKSE